MSKITLKLEDGIHHIAITKGCYNGYDGWWVDFEAGRQAFLRKEYGEWIQRLGDSLSISDIKSITAAMYECQCE